MTIDELKAALLRYGYRIHEPKKPTLEDYMRIIVIRDASPVLVFSRRTLEDDVTLEMLKDLLDCHGGNNQHHVCCGQCKEPLLQKEIVTIGIPERVFDPDYKPEPKQYKYRSAKTGPLSFVLSVCPGCGIELSKETVKEIEDNLS